MAIKEIINIRPYNHELKIVSQALGYTAEEYDQARLLMYKELYKAKVHSTSHFIEILLNIPSIPYQLKMFLAFQMGEFLSTLASKAKASDGFSSLDDIIGRD